MKIKHKKKSAVQIVYITFRLNWISLIKLVSYRRAMVIFCLTHWKKFNKKGYENQLAFYLFFSIAFDCEMFLLQNSNFSKYLFVYVTMSYHWQNEKNGFLLFFSIYSRIFLTAQYVTNRTYLIYSFIYYSSYTFFHFSRE